MTTWLVDRVAHPVVPLTLALDAADDALVFVGFETRPDGHPTSLAAHAKRFGAELEDEKRPSTPPKTQLLEYLEGDRTAFDLPLRLLGTSFQVEAWNALRRIPYGHTSTYGAQARTIGRPAAARAVGRANATNPIPIIVPCHRIIGSSGKLTGFGGGLDVKRWLLDLEQPNLFA